MPRKISNKTRLVDAWKSRVGIAFKRKLKAVGVAAAWRSKAGTAMKRKMKR